MEINSDTRKFKLLSFSLAVILAFAILIISGFIGRYFYGGQTHELTNISNNVRVTTGTFTIGVLFMAVVSRKIKKLRLTYKWLLVFYVIDVIFSFAIYNSLI